jgi:hypothetical protein
VKSGQCKQVLIGHTEPIAVISLSADARFACSGSTDKTIRLWDLVTGQCLGVYESPHNSVFALALSRDGRWFISGGDEKVLHVHEIDWELAAREPADWDQGALPLLETFLASHMPYISGLRADRDLSAEKILHALTRQGKPVWRENDVQSFLTSLQYAGYGWLRPESIREKLDEIARQLN